MPVRTGWASWASSLRSHDRTWWYLSAGETALWAVLAIYIVHGGEFWWHFSGAAGAALCLRAKRAQRTRAQRGAAKEADPSALAESSDAGR